MAKKKESPKPKTIRPPKEIIAGTVSSVEIPPMATSKRPDIKGFIPKATVGGFKNDEFEILANRHFSGHKVKIEWVSSRQCYVWVNGQRIDRVFIGRAV